MALPKAYVEELNELNREVAQQQPANVIEFCANYFNRRLEEQQSGGGSGLFKQSFGEAGGGGLKFNMGSLNDSSHQGPGQTQFPVDFNAGRRTSVSAESLNPDAHATPPLASGEMNKLSDEQVKRLNASVTKNFLFSNLDDDSLHSVLSCLQEKHVPANTDIIVQGDEGDFFYVLESGEVEIIKDGQSLGKSGAGVSFGELALMYNAPRAATVRATSNCVLWALDRLTFRRVLLHKTASKRSMYETFLKEVPVLKVLGPYELSKLADALNSETYEANETVVREGDTGDNFYLIESGTAQVARNDQGVVQELSKGDYFGEVALLNDMPRQATVTATSKLKVATLGRSGFQRLLGPVVDILKRQDPTSTH
jgi:cAMP-dependent protein kinase regulator